MEVKSLHFGSRSGLLTLGVGYFNNKILLVAVEIMAKLNSLNLNWTVLGESSIIASVLLPSPLENCLCSVYYRTSLLNRNKADSKR